MYYAPRAPTLHAGYVASKVQGLWSFSNPTIIPKEFLHFLFHLELLKFSSLLSKLSLEWLDWSNCLIQHRKRLSFKSSYSIGWRPKARVRSLVLYPRHSVTSGGGGWTLSLGVLTHPMSHYASISNHSSKDGNNLNNTVQLSRKNSLFTCNVFVCHLWHHS